MRWQAKGQGKFSEEATIVREGGRRTERGPLPPWMTKTLYHVMVHKGIGPPANASQVLEHR